MSRIMTFPQRRTDDQHSVHTIEKHTSNLLVELPPLGIFKYLLLRFCNTKSEYRDIRKG